MTIRAYTGEDWDRLVALPHPDVVFAVTCGADDTHRLNVTHRLWHMLDLVPCPCGSAADLVHARRHVDCGLCTAPDDETPTAPDERTAPVFGRVLAVEYLTAPGVRNRA